MPYDRSPAQPDEACPKCGNANPDARKVSIWRVSDERGLHLECEVCAHAWKLLIP